MRLSRSGAMRTVPWIGAPDSSATGAAAAVRSRRQHGLGALGALGAVREDPRQIRLARLLLRIEGFDPAIAAGERERDAEQGDPASRAHDRTVAKRARVAARSAIVRVVRR